MECRYPNKTRTVNANRNPKKKIQRKIGKYHPFRANTKYGYFRVRNHGDKTGNVSVYEKNERLT